jgi:hypothetical protein
MHYLRRERYDYFIIWGHGLKYKDVILDIIRNTENITIVRIVKHKPKSIRHLVKVVYSYDYAPLYHLKEKTKYLMTTAPEVLFVFLHNTDARQIYRGEGDFRHIECERIKRIKEEIRNKLNERKNDRRTEDHVVHASDNESQVDYILKYLGFKDGIRRLKNVPNPNLSLPYYIYKFDKFTIQCVNLSQLRCNILRGTKGSFWKEALEVEKTPHFLCLTGNAASYKEYLTKFMGGQLTCDYSVKNLMELSRNFAYLEPPYAASYILTKEFKPNQYLILDGVHRASVLRVRGINSFPVAVIK